MSDDAPETGADEETQEKKFFADRAKTGRATCRKCKQKLEAGKLRLAKAGFNPFGPGLMKQWHHVDCLFEVFTKQRKTTAKIESPDDIEGWSDLDDEDQEEILKHLPGCSKDTRTSSNKTDTKTKTDSTPQKSEKKQKKKDQPSVEQSLKDHKDNSFREFRRLCADIANENTYTGKTALVKDFFAKGTDGKGFKGDLLLWCRLLLPGHVKRVYNLQSKQLVKLFSRIFHTDHDDMLEDLENGDVAETISTFFEKSNHVQPTKKSLLTLPEVDQYLEKLSELSKEDEQINHFKNIVKRCTSNDLKMFIRLIKHDLRINAGPKHILEAVHSDAYQAFQASRDLEAVISKAVNKSSSGVSSPSKKTSLGITVSLMTPVLPMLAEACKSVEFAMKKCPNGMYSEIKYDGERVQLHKKGDDYKFFSRSLKPVLPHKVNQFKDYIPEAFPHGNDLILDCEVLMIDTQTGKPLPFGTLGIHKKNAFKDANVCLFVFDCIYFNGDVLVSRPIKERKKILKDNMTEIPFRILLSEVEEIHKPKDLESMITKVLQQGLEGLVLKDLMSIYEPGKRHWLKVKKDYLFGGAMADSADLVVLGAWFGTGQKENRMMNLTRSGGMMSVFLMGCYDPARQKWCTVTKVHTGHDDKTLERLQDELKMVKISKEASKVPNWLIATKTMIPDFVAKDPKVMPVWEITGAEFTQQHDVHTADGISIRFPRVTKIRDDKNWETATSLPELRALFKKSKNTTDIKFPSTRKEDTDEENESESEAKSSKKTTSKIKSGNMEKNKNSAKKLKMDSSDSDSENETESKSSKKAAVKDKPDKSEKNPKKLKIDSSDSDSEQELKSKSKGKRMAEVKHDDFKKNQKIVKKAKVDSSESDQEHDSESDSKSSKRKAEKRKSEKVEENQQSVKRSREDSSESCEESKMLHGCKRLRIHVRPLSELMPVNTVKTPCSEDSFILDTAESPIIGTNLKHVKSLDSTIINDAAQDSQGNKKSSETCYENTETFTTSDSSILPQIIALDVEHKVCKKNAPNENESDNESDATHIIEDDTHIIEDDIHIIEDDTHIIEYDTTSEVRNPVDDAKSEGDPANEYEDNTTLQKQNSEQERDNENDTSSESKGDSTDEYGDDVTLDKSNNVECGNKNNNTSSESEEDYTNENEDDNEGDAALAIEESAISEARNLVEGSNSGEDHTSKSGKDCTSENEDNTALEIQNSLEHGNKENDTNSDSTDGHDDDDVTLEKPDSEEYDKIENGSNGECEEDSTSVCEDDVIVECSENENNVSVERDSIEHSGSDEDCSSKNDDNIASGSRNSKECNGNIDALNNENEDNSSEQDCNISRNITNFHKQAEIENNIDGDIEQNATTKMKKSVEREEIKGVSFNECDNNVPSSEVKNSAKHAEVDKNSASEQNQNTSEGGKSPKHNKRNNYSTSNVKKVVKRNKIKRPASLKPDNPQECVTGTSDSTVIPINASLYCKGIVSNNYKRLRSSFEKIKEKRMKIDFESNCEKQLLELRFKNEKELLELKIKNEKELHELKLHHMNELHEIKIRETSARAELAQLLLEKEKKN